MANRIMAGILVILVLVTIFQSRTINQLNKDVSAAHELADTAASEAFGDCQRMLGIQVIMAQYNGCYNAVEQMCGGQSKCMEKYRYVCEDRE